MTRHASPAAALLLALVLALVSGMITACASTVEEAEQMDLCDQQAAQACAEGDEACLDQAYVECMEAAGYFMR